MVWFGKNVLTDVIFICCSFQSSVLSGATIDDDPEAECRRCCAFNFPVSSSIMPSTRHRLFNFPTIFTVHFFTAYFPFSSSLSSSVTFSFFLFFSSYPCFLLPPSLSLPYPMTPFSHLSSPYYPPSLPQSFFPPSLSHLHHSLLSVSSSSPLLPPRTLFVSHYWRYVLVNI